MSKEIRKIIDKVKNFKQFVNENVTDNKQFVVKNHLFELLINNVVVSKSKFNIENSDEFFNQNYVSIYELETIEQFRGKGYAKQLLDEIFNYVKNTLNLDIITLIVDKDNQNAINLYFNTGFEIFIEYENSYSLVKKLNKNS